MGITDSIMKPLVTEKGGPLTKTEIEKTTALEKLKLEQKEQKEVKSEMEKLAWLEHKASFKAEVKEWAVEKPPMFEKASAGEKDLAEGPSIDDAARAALAQHADALEAAAGTLRHFIAQSERPDLRKGALANDSEEASSETDVA